MGITCKKNCNKIKDKCTVNVWQRSAGPSNVIGVTIKSVQTVGAVVFRHRSFISHQSFTRVHRSIIIINQLKLFIFVYDVLVVCPVQITTCDLTRFRSISPWRFCHPG